jgi:uncharacterized membrane protein HdeD (DUF308 family)
VTRLDRVSLVAGVALAAFGLLLLLDQAEAIDLSPGIAGAALATTVGAILVASGLTEEER